MNAAVNIDRPQTEREGVPLPLDHLTEPRLSALQIELATSFLQVVSLFEVSLHSARAIRDPGLAATVRERLAKLQAEIEKVKEALPS